MSGHCFYFAYGSNLHPLRLQARVPSARVRGLTVLAGHALHFGKRGLDGSGKCTVKSVAGANAAVHGVLFELRTAERPALDAAEGPDYARRSALFRLGEQSLSGFYYEARNHALDNDLLPFDWYRELVVRGARFHGFPDSYVGGLAQVRCRPDPDARRVARMQALLERMSVF